MFWTNKKFAYLIFINKLTWYHPKLMYKNIVQKNMKKFYDTIISFIFFLFCWDDIESTIWDLATFSSWS